MDIALAIVYHPDADTVLIARRKDSTHQGSLWEFPGGKCEPGEAPAGCAVRETWEETGLCVQVLEAWPAIIHNYPDRTLTLHPFLCRALTENALPIASQEVRWVEISSLDSYPFPPANTSLLARLRGE